MLVKFWGVRGGIARGSDSFQNVGGDTSCVSIKIDEHHLIIFDAGTGLITLGQTLLKHPIKNIHLLLSHMHYDHVIGLPFFEPLYDPRFFVNLYGPAVEGSKDFDDFLNNKLFAKPFFPVPFSITNANKKIFNIKNHDEINIQNATLLSAPLNHPGNAIGYRLLANNKIVAYISDTEHEPNKPDHNVLNLIKEADLVIYDTTYTEEEFQTRKGWGHSTPEEGIKLCQLSKAKKLALYHHSHLHTDEILSKVERDAKKLWNNVVLSKEGMEINLNEIPREQ